MRQTPYPFSPNKQTNKQTVLTLRFLSTDENREFFSRGFGANPDANKFFIRSKIIAWNLTESEKKPV